MRYFRLAVIVVFAAGVGTLVAGSLLASPRANGSSATAASGGILYSVDGSGDDLWAIDPATGVGALIGDTGIVRVHGLAFSSSGDLFGASWPHPEPSLVTLDLPTGAASVVGRTHQAMGLAFSPAGTLYAVNSATDELLEIDPSTGAYTTVATVTGADGLVALAFSGSGTLYASDAASDSLVTLDPATGVASLVGPVGFGDVQGIAFGEGILYGVDNITDSLIHINPATGEGTLIGPVSPALFGGPTSLAFFDESAQSVGGIVRLQQDGDVPSDSRSDTAISVGASVAAGLLLLGAAGLYVTGMWRV